MNVVISTKRYLTCGMLVIICLLFGFLHAQAQGANVNQTKQPDKKGNVGAASQGREITGEARVAIALDADVEEIKTNAIEKAKDDVLIKAAGFFVNQNTLIKDKEYVLRVLKPKADEIIEEIKLVSEQKSDDGFYKVKIMAKVKKEVVENLLVKNLFDDRAIVVTLEKSSKKILKEYILESELTKKVKSKGYTIVDYRSIKNDTTTKLISAVQQSNREAIKKIGLYYLADIVVSGAIEASFSEKVQEIYSAHAKGHVKIYSIGQQKELISVIRNDMKGFGANEDKACTNAVEKGSNLLVDEAMKGLPQKQAKNVKVIIREVGDYPCKKSKIGGGDLVYSDDKEYGLSCRTGFGTQKVRCC
jgi:hypothetical protein